MHLQKNACMYVHCVQTFYMHTYIITYILIHLYLYIHCRYICTQMYTDF